MSNWEIKTETINDDYYWGEFGGFRVVIRAEDGYINGTKLAGEAGKQFKHWKANKQTQEYVHVVTSSVGIPTDDLMDVVTGGRLAELRGTYVHPKLVIHLAQWCSAEYGYKVTEIVMDHHAREHRERARAEKKARRLLEQKVAAQQAELGDRQDKIDRKRVKISDLKLMMAEMMAKQAQDAHQTHTRLDVLQEDVTEVRGELVHVSRKLGVAKDQRVPPADSPGAVHHNLVLRLFNPKKRKNKHRRDYACIRAQQSSIAGCLALSRQVARVR